LQSEDKLWVSLFTDKYLKEGALFLDIATNGSPTRQAILKALHLLKDGFTFKIGDGDTNI